MPRNLDLTALRSFVAVADTGGVTRAAGLLNLTQSAVSMQLKRLEDSLDTQLLDRSGRGVALTPSGDQLLSLARRVLDLNDEIYRRMTSTDYEGEIVVGVPHDIVYPVIPRVLQRFAKAYPRMKVQLQSSFTRSLKDSYAKGAADLILTTEIGADPGAETLASRRLVWMGARGGQAWRSRPLRIAFEERCFFRDQAQRALDTAGIPWEMAVHSDATRTIEATISADLAVNAMLEGTHPVHLEPVDHGGALPVLNTFKINMYHSELGKGPAVAEFAQLLRQEMRDPLRGHDNLASGFAVA